MGFTLFKICSLVMLVLYPAEDGKIPLNLIPLMVMVSERGGDPCGNCRWNQSLHSIVSSEPILLEVMSTLMLSNRFSSSYPFVGFDWV